MPHLGGGGGWGGLSGGVGGWCFSCICSVCACLNLSVSSSSWCLGGAAVCGGGTPWTFLLPFFGSTKTYGFLLTRYL